MHAITPPVITATGNQMYCGAPLKIIQTISIVHDPLEPETEAVYVQISSGYSTGADKLSLANFSTHNAKNIYENWDSASGKLKLSSPSGAKILYADFEAALKDVVFSTNQTTPSGGRTFSITIGQANYLPSTQHYYEFVPSTGISWTDAKSAAESRNYYGLKGYLATIMTADEAQLTGKQSSGAGWIGGTDASTEGVWKWVTGPEGLANGGNGVVFWNGLANGFTPNFAFWNTNEPNQGGSAGIDEDYAHITVPGFNRVEGSWNDLKDVGNSSGDYQPKGYIVEYGGMPIDPILQIAASTSISIPTKIDFESATGCFAGSLTLKPKTSLETVKWYDAPTGGTLLNTGNTFTTPNITSTTSYFVDTTNGACPLSAFNPRVEVIAEVISPSIVASSISNPICGNGTTTLNVTASPGTNLNWYKLPVGGTSLATGNSYTTPNLTTNTTFYVEATQSSCVSNRTPITVAVGVVPTIIATFPATRCGTGSVVLSASTLAGTLNWYANASGGSPIGTGNTITPTVSKTTLFYVEVTHLGCTSTRKSVVASVYPINSDTEEIVLCQNETKILDASIPGLTYTWSPNGETTQSIPVSSIGNYEVIISSPIATSCGSKKIFNVVEHPKPVLKELVITDNSLLIQLTNPKEYYEYSIDGFLFQKSNQFSYIPSGPQMAYVRENNSCNLISQPFTVFYISTFFTPNNDGINDTWFIPELKNYLGSNVKIFDRYGKILKLLDAGNLSWNGKFNNLDLPADDYWYVLRLDETQPEIRGHFTLKR